MGKGLLHNGEGCRMLCWMFRPGSCELLSSLLFSLCNLHQKVQRAPQDLTARGISIAHSPLSVLQALTP